MTYKHFNFQIIWRLALIFTIFILIQLLWGSLNYPITVSLLAVFAASLIYSLVHYLNRVNRDFTRFVSAIKNNDFQDNYSRPSNKSFIELYEAFNSLRDRFIEERNEKIDRYYLLQSVVEHIKVALVSFNSKGEIDIYNHTARQLFNKPHIFNVNDLNSFSKELVELMKNGTLYKRHFISLNYSGQLYKLSLEIVELNINNELSRLLSIQDLKVELDQNEFDSWQKLIRVLNHEIFNSITPILSLAETTRDSISAYKDDLAKDFNDIEKSFNTIETRSKHLLSFVEQFRSISHLPKAKLAIVSISKLLESMESLFKTELREANIFFVQKTEPKSLELSIDISLVEQVLINIIKNAIDAVKDSKKKEIKITAFIKKNQSFITISDTGSGISVDALDKVFIPFFTTKANGSGIGLSLSKQLMKLHGADIQVKSKHGLTEFALIFQS